RRSCDGRIQGKKQYITTVWILGKYHFRLYPKVMNTLKFLSFSLITFFGGIFVLKGYNTVGGIVIFTYYARKVIRPFNELSNQFNILLSAVAGAERVFSILDEDVEEIDETDAKTITETSGSFEFKQVNFSYEDKKVLHDISFTVAPGEMVAFVGHTGA